MTDYQFPSVTDVTITLRGPGMLKRGGDGYGTVVNAKVGQTVIIDGPTLQNNDGTVLNVFGAVILKSGVIKGGKFGVSVSSGSFTMEGGRH